MKSTCAIIDEYTQEDAARFWQGDTHEKYDEMIAEKMKEVWQRLSDDYLVLSDEFISCLEKGFKTGDEDERMYSYWGMRRSPRTSEICIRAYWQSLKVKFTDSDR